MTDLAAIRAVWERATKECAAELAEFFYPANPPYRSKEAMADDMALVVARHTAARDLLTLAERQQAEIAELRAAVKPLARLELPKKPQGNAGAYSIFHADIQRAKDIIGSAVAGKET